MHVIDLTSGVVSYRGYSNINHTPMNPSRRTIPGTDYGVEANAGLDRVRRATWERVLCFVWAPSGIRITVLLLLFCRAYGTFVSWRETPGCTNTGLQKQSTGVFRVCRVESVALTLLQRMIKRVEVKIT